jgi:hypothetical protein
MRLCCSACSHAFDVETASTMPMPCPHCGRPVTRIDALHGPRAAPASSGTLPDRFGRYRVLAEVGSGAFGKVYRGRDDTLQRDVAIKVPHPHRLAAPGAVDSYLKEARTLADLDYPGIVPVYDFDRTAEGGCYLVSKFIDGTDLAARLRPGRLPFDETARLVARVAEALHHAHRRGLVHRDVKPANILLDAEGNPRVGDFGLALRDEDFGRGGGSLGTPAYMSPEQARGDSSRLDGRSDIFSLGVILYEMLAGASPYRGVQTLSDLARQIKEVDPRPPRQVDDRIPQELERICLKALAKRPPDRHSTALDLAEDLLDWLAGTSRPAAAAAAPAPPAEVPEGLRDCLCTFDAFVDDRTQGFVGRDFVFRQVDAFLADPANPSGYFLIRGEPGIGKSALLARLVKDRGCLHHFNIALQGINTPRQFLRNVCAQLILRYRLPHAQLPPDVHESGAFLNRLLQEASDARGAAPVVLAIDALDEVDRDSVPGTANILFLPPNLPPAVFVVATTRPLDQLRLVASRLKTLDLRPDSEGNLADVGACIAAHLSQEGLRGWLAEQGLTAEEFTAALVRKSEGNFMYLHHVLPALTAGRYRDIAVDDLPDGLLAYYRTHWAQMQRQDTGLFGAVYQPVVCVLAAAHEAVSPDQVAEWTALETAQVRRVLREWREFLYEERAADGVRRFRVYHTSFREYLQSEVDPGLRTYHRMIADSALRKVRRARQAAARPAEKGP